MTERTPKKPSPAKKTAAKTQKRKPSRRKARRIKLLSPGWAVRLLMYGMLLALIGGTAFYGALLHYQDVVRVKFEGKRWAVPAHVFARPLEIYPGAPVTREQVLYEVAQLGYREVKNAGSPGTYDSGDEKGELAIFSRDFTFWDGTEKARRITLTFNDQGVAGIRDVNGADLALIRLESMQIGSIYPAHKEDRVLVRYEDIPRPLIGGLLASEDREFFEHKGVSLKGISRAMWTNLRAGRAVQGGSTLTQQLVKNFFLTSERSLKRKANEAMMALALESRYPKEEILQAYANEIYLGQDGQRAIHGFGLAARFYFNQPLQELSVKDQAMLVALIRGPSYYNPLRNPERTKERRDLILDLMAEYGVVKPEVAKRAKAGPLGLHVNRQSSGGGVRFPAFMDLVSRQLKRDYREEDLNSEGLKIHTTLDPWVQRQSEENLRARLDEIEKKKRKPKGTYEAAVIVVLRDTGEVQSIVGGRHSDYAGFNRALDAVRPIGSLIKPAIYLTALQVPELYSLATPIDDGPYQLEIPGQRPWTPTNYDHQSHGFVPLYKSLAKSYNQATVRLGMDVGLYAIADTMKKLGITRNFKVYPSMLLGSTSLTPLEVVQMYQTYASGGYRTPLRTIRDILDQDGKPLQRYPLDVRQVLPESSVHLINTAMQYVVSAGTATSSKKYLPASVHAAGKTGTTNELRDSWFAGFTGDRVAVAWVGRDDNKPTGLSGASGALQIWASVMGSIHPQPLELIRPDHVVMAKANLNSGLLAGPDCDGTMLPFIDIYLPAEGGCGDDPFGSWDGTPGSDPNGAASGRGGESRQWKNPWEL